MAEADPQARNRRWLEAHAAFLAGDFREAQERFATVAREAWEAQDWAQAGVAWKAAAAEADREGNPQRSRELFERAAESYSRLASELSEPVARSARIEAAHCWLRADDPQSAADAIASSARSDNGSEDS